MARATATKTTKPAPETTAEAPAVTRNCACGCGESVERVFRQGHDQRLVSKLAQDIVYANVWDGKCLGILKNVDLKADIQVRIDKVSDYVAAKLTEALANKFEKAAARAWELEKTKSERADAKAARKAAADAKPKRARKVAADSSEEAEAAAPKPRTPRNTKPVATNADIDALEAQESPEVAGGHRLGQEVKVRVGQAKRTRVAKVTGMNQAGKVTAVTVTTNGKDSVKTEDQFTIVNG